jgi:hypothetical protein
MKTPTPDRPIKAPEISPMSWKLVCPICGGLKSTRQHRAKADKCSRETKRRAEAMKKGYLHQVGIP